MTICRIKEIAIYKTAHLFQFFLIWNLIWFWCCAAVKEFIRVALPFKNKITIIWSWIIVWDIWWTDHINTCFHSNLWKFCTTQSRCVFYTGIKWWWKEKICCKFRWFTIIFIYLTINCTCCWYIITRPPASQSFWSVYTHPTGQSASWPEHSIPHGSLSRSPFPFCAAA